MMGAVAVDGEPVPVRGTGGEVGAARLRKY
jgi:hypothetical protein